MPSPNAARGARPNSSASRSRTPIAQARYVPLGHGEQRARRRSAERGHDPGAGGPRRRRSTRLRPLLEDPSSAKLAHDPKPVSIALAGHGIDAARLAFDSMLASYLLDATRSQHRLEDTALEHLGYKAVTEDDVCGTGRQGACRASDVSPEALLQLRRRTGGSRAPAVAQAGAAARVARAWRPSTRSSRCRWSPVLADIERAGIRVDTDALAAQSRHLEQELAELYGAHLRAGGRGVQRQLAEAARRGPVREAEPAGAEEDRQDPVGVDGRRGAGGAGAQSHELPRLILDWRELQKLKSTYIDALPLLVNPKTGRVHTSFNQAVAATGRLSSSDPNLQNIPIRTETRPRDPPRVHRRAGPRADLGRLLADRAAGARAPGRRGDADRGVPIGRGHPRPHGAQGVRPDSGLDPHELRRRAKIVNYALLYGKTAFTLAKDIGVTKEAAQEFIDAYFAGFPRVRAVHRRHARRRAPHRRRARRCSAGGGWCRI